MDRTLSGHTTVRVSLEARGHSSVRVAASWFAFLHPSHRLVKVNPGTCVRAITGPRGSLGLWSAVYSQSKNRQREKWSSRNHCLALTILTKINFLQTDGDRFLSQRLDFTCHRFPTSLNDIPRRTCAPVYRAHLCNDRLRFSTFSYTRSDSTQFGL